MNNKILMGIIAVFVSGSAYAGCEIAGKHFWDPIAPSNNYVQCGQGSYFDGQGCACDDRNYVRVMTCKDNENGIKHFRFKCVPRKTVCQFDPEFRGFKRIYSPKPTTQIYVRCGRGTHWNSDTQQCVCDNPASDELTKVCEVTKQGSTDPDNEHVNFIQQIWEAQPKEQ